MASLKYSVPAIKDLEEIRNYIAVYRKIRYLRQILFNAYRIVYQFKSDTVTIVTVHHQSRLLENVPQIKDYKE